MPYLPCKRAVCARSDMDGPSEQLAILAGGRRWTTSYFQSLYKVRVGHCRCGYMTFVSSVICIRRVVCCCDCQLASPPPSPHTSHLAEATPALPSLPSALHLLTPFLASSVQHTLQLWSLCHVLPVHCSYLVLRTCRRDKPFRYAQWRSVTHTTNINIAMCRCPSDAAGAADDPLLPYQRSYYHTYINTNHLNIHSVSFV